MLILQIQDKIRRENYRLPHGLRTPFEEITLTARLIVIVIVIVWQSKGSHTLEMEYR